MKTTPKNIYKGTNSDGSTFTVKEWDFKTLNDLHGVWFIIGLFVAFLLCSITSPLLAIVSLLKKKIGLINILGLVIGVYFLVDYYHNWLTTSAFKIFFREPYELIYIMVLNVMALIVHVISIGIILVRIKNKRDKAL